MKNSASKKVHPVLPIDKLVICGFKYAVEHPKMDDCVIVETGEHYFGYHDQRDRHIEIARDVSLDQQLQTMWHEILEAITATHDIDMDHQTLSTISNELWRIHADNRWRQFDGSR